MEKCTFCVQRIREHEHSRSPGTVISAATRS